MHFPTLMPFALSYVTFCRPEGRNMSQNIVLVPSGPGGSPGNRMKPVQTKGRGHRREWHARRAGLEKRPE